MILIWVGFFPPPPILSLQSHPYFPTPGTGVSWSFRVEAFPAAHWQRADPRKSLEALLGSGADRAQQADIQSRRMQPRTGSMLSRCLGRPGTAAAPAPWGHFSVSRAFRRKPKVLFVEMWHPPTSSPWPMAPFLAVSVIHAPSALTPLDSRK